VKVPAELVTIPSPFNSEAEIVTIPSPFNSGESEPESCLGRPKAINHRGNMVHDGH